jgi:hypothetical protein
MSYNRKQDKLIEHFEGESAKKDKNCTRKETLLKRLIEV